MIRVGIDVREYECGEDASDERNTEFLQDVKKTGFIAAHADIDWARWRLEASEYRVLAPHDKGLRH
ncbi:MAG: hypothetical protein ACJAYU_004312 [Bradymonadia bacterium]|jgi:hypothetical protein